MTTRKERFLRAVRSNTQLKVGFAMLLLLILVALLAGVIAPYDPYKLSDDLVTAPSATHLLGTDHLGRDVFSMLVYGTRVSLMIGRSMSCSVGVFRISSSVS